MLNAYRHLLEKVKGLPHKEEHLSWDTLKQAIETAEQKASILEVLTEQEMLQVQKDLKADLEQTAEYLVDFEKDAGDFIKMEWEALEGFLMQKSEELADPTELMVLRMRLAAAMEQPKTY